MEKFKVIKQINFGSGFVHDKMGNAVPMQNFAPKIGDTILLGEPKQKYFGSVPTKGFDFLIKQDGVSPDTLVFIPVETLAPAVETIFSDSSQTFFTPKNITIGVLAIGAILVCGYAIAVF